MAVLPDDWDPAEIIEHAVATVIDEMREDGGFAPFAITIDGNGETEGIFPQSIDDSGDNIDDMTALINSLRDEAHAGDHAAVVLIADAWVSKSPDAERRDAVVIHFEYRDGYAQKSYFFYELEERPGDGKTPYHVEIVDAETEQDDHLIFDPA